MPDTFSPPLSGQETFTLVSSYGVYDREFAETLGMRVPKSRELDWMRRLDGRLQKRTVRRHEYYYYEEGQYFSSSVTVEAVDVGTPNQVGITLSAADHQSAGTSSWPVVGQMCTFSDETTGYVLSVDKGTPSAHEIVVLREDANQDVQTAAVIGSKVVFHGMAVGEKSVGTDSRVPQIDKNTNYMTTTRWKWDATDFALQNDVEFRYKGSKQLYVKTSDDAMDTFANYESFNLLVNHGTDSGDITDDNGDSIKTAQALIPQIDEGGQTLEYYGTPDMQTFNDWELVSDASYGDTEYLLGCGKNAEQGLRGWLVDFINAGGNNSDMFAGQDKKSIDIQFATAQFGAYKYHIDTWACLSHNDSFGADGFPHRHMVIGIPLGTTKDPGNEGNNFQASTVPLICQVYSKPQGVASTIHDDVMIWETGALARPYPDGETQERVGHVISYKSLELRARNKFFMARKGD